ncbi:hypothetical protein AC629_34345 [Bradyrhizobium sp. NAS80.1]|uniref:hypothetical protein n=1 Tax=Bradyrhizobium sp. NAS80.1 TaxID=1680159 RepID=UPI000969018F|nr:hypothetical protein [Bradyrhizobium sp. NAS80.1]OKO75120.1 hypothetical protein AC629_34345 [Bradyrhizobium sp. NAS80.1]
MTNDNPSKTPAPVAIARRLSPRVFKRPEHVANVLKSFGSQRQSTLREIDQELDRMATSYRIALKNRAPKFEEVDPILDRFENSLRKIKAQWLHELRPLHPAIIALRIKMIPPSQRKQKAGAAMATINLDLVATTLLRTMRKLRVSKEYAAAHYQPSGKSFERAFLWEPFLRLMKKHRVKLGQHGSFSAAIKSLHLALGIDPPTGALKKNAP